MRFILDTNVLSELRRPERAHPGVVAWTDRYPKSDFFLAAVSVLELELGALRMERRDRDQGAVLRAWIERRILPEFEGRIMPLDTAVARRTAILHVPDPRSERDAMIAATAHVHRMTVMTRNTAAFLETGVPLVNPWIDVPPPP